VWGPSHVLNEMGTKACQLAAHLLNSFDNERVEIADVRGVVAQDIFTVSPSIQTNTQGSLTREQYLDDGCGHRSS
jgi:hypothetical protein